MKHKISIQPLRIDMRSVSKLISYVRNARTHSEKQVAQIAATITQFGGTNPILVGADDVIIGGHARVLAAQKLGMTEVPVISVPHLRLEADDRSFNAVQAERIGGAA